MKNTFWFLFTGLLFMLIAVFVAHVVSGPADLSWNEVMHGLLNPSSPSGAILWKLRLPRAVYAVITGMGLAACGLALQGLFRNPLAEPFTLGISGGAGFGAVLAIVSGVTAGIWVSVSAMVGAVIVTALVFVLSQHTRFSQSALILCGIMLGYFFQSLLMMLISLSSSNRAHGALMWLLGDLGSAPTSMLATACVVVIAGCLLMFRKAKELDLLSMGEEKTASLGVNAGHLRREVFFISSMVTGACVAAVGIVGFVGLMIPHIIRYPAGTQHRVLFPLCILGGASFVLFCDLIAKNAFAPIELPLGVITGLIGSVTFLWMFVRKEA